MKLLVYFLSSLLVGCTIIVKDERPPQVNTVTQNTIVCKLPALEKLLARQAVPLAKYSEQEDFANAALHLKRDYIETRNLLSLIATEYTKCLNKSIQNE